MILWIYKEVDNLHAELIKREHEYLFVMLFQASPFSASTSSAETDKNILASKLHFFIYRDVISSPDGADSQTVNLLPEDIYLQFPQFFLHFHWDPHMVTLLLQGPNSQRRLCSLSPGCNSSCAIMKLLCPWQWDPAARGLSWLICWRKHQMDKCTWNHSFL